MCPCTSIRGHVCPSVGWSVSLSRKCQNRAELPILASIFILVTFPLSFTFIYFHLHSFTFIHLHLLSFTSYFHPFMHASIKNVNSSKTFILFFFFSQLKRVTLLYQMKLKFQCHTSRRLMEKIKKKAKFAPKLVSRDLRKNERINEWMNE